MAKKALSIGLIFLFILSLATSAYCDDALRKLGRGFCNLLTFPLELPEQIQRTNNSDGPMAAMTYGVLKGFGMGALRAAVGAFEILTFPIPFPRGYRPILIDPEFFFEEKTW